MNKWLGVGRLAKPLRIVTILLLIAAGRLGNAGGQTLTVLYQLNDQTNGVSPYPGLVQGSDGDFYGTTFMGGTNEAGTVFRVSSAGTFTTLWQFNRTDGYYLVGGVAQGSDGNFYGTTANGGTNGDGTVFRISPSGSLTTLCSFSGNSGPNPGYGPGGGLFQGSDGNFYGTTEYGGTNGGGTVFRISSAGTFTTLWQFSGTDGQYPYAGPVQGTDGYFYGTTSQGGTNGAGTVFRISSAGSLTTLWQFSGTDGRNPFAGLAQGSEGNFYGTTYGGGTNNAGTVFRISPPGTLTTLYNFGNTGSYGAGVYAGLVQGSDGNFYGATEYGGASTNCSGGCGTLFQITPSGSLTTFYSFHESDGRHPNGGLVQGYDGAFYGTTYWGGAYDDGVLFRICVPLNPPANQISAICLADTTVAITIPSVAGETYQLQFAADPASGAWSNVPGVSVTNSIGSTLTFTNPAGASPQGFYRFAITP